MYLPNLAGQEKQYFGSGGSGEPDNELGKNEMEKLKQPKVRLQHSYYYATIINFRSLPHFAFDMVLLFLATTFFFGGMSNLVAKGRMENYHQKW